MKLINFLFCLITLFTLQWSTAFATEIKFPKDVNIKKNEKYKIQATIGILSYDKDGGLGYSNDVPINNCGYDDKNKTVLCNLTHDNRKFNFTFNVKVENKNKCKITNSTTFKKANLYSYDSEDKKYILDEYLVFLELEKDKITTFECNTRKFTLLTNDNCEFTLKIQQAKARVSRNKQRK
ncbi:hypothetical protein H8356DRAFT_1736992 [Neocallimastix lanati (nom. inval.)]|jgi:hypothetical protein|uniref:Autophagy-related protein 27 n=1 Tax=Neocallimastix californiae TaxID=1754190 RepID=A0A1Y2C506_9FUNG|nr:hypothetical protein H8356DRAFT_1736992 [Neocallimastix sp. JGI-2020a]ORY42101.1 hypothetical protein LY90DRAFT_703881 [Neocallimastix californiae]|eukprot:ORY42101.1 hypothetical protein LY90DRAFT_703881 [Neocallimastix californiae]